MAGVGWGGTSEGPIQGAMCEVILVWVRPGATLGHAKSEMPITHVIADVA